MGDLRKARETAMFARTSSSITNHRTDDSPPSKANANANANAIESSNPKTDSQERNAKAKLQSAKEEWEKQQDIYLRLETKSHELRTIYRGIASR